MIQAEVSEQIEARTNELTELQVIAEEATKLAEDRDESVKNNME